MFQQLVQHGRAYNISKTIVVNEYEVDQRDHLPGKKIAATFDRSNITTRL